MFSKARELTNRTPRKKKKKIMGLFLVSISLSEKAQ